MNVLYVDSDRLQVRFHTLVIDISSLRGSLDTVLRFSEDNNLQFITNGRLLLAYSMNSDFSYLSELVSCCVEPQGFRYRIAYTFIEEQLTIGVDGAEPLDFLGKELPETYDLDWICSEIALDGCFIWRNPDKKREHFSNLVKTLSV